MDVLKGVYQGYGTQPHIPFLNATNPNKPESVGDVETYLEKNFPKMDRFRGCKVEMDEERDSTDPNRPPKHDEL